MAAHALDVIGGDLLEVRPAVIGEDGEHHPAIEVRRAAFDDAHPHQPVEPTGEAAGGELQARREVAHAHRRDRRPPRGARAPGSRRASGRGVRGRPRGRRSGRPPSRRTSARPPSRSRPTTASNPSAWSRQPGYPMRESIVAMVRICRYSCDRKGSPPPLAEGRIVMSQTSTTTTLPTGTWDLDVAHSHVGFTVRHLMVSKVRGTFQDFSAAIVTRRRPLGLDAQRDGPDGLDRHRRRQPRRPPADQRLLRRRAVPDDDVHLDAAHRRGLRVRGHGRPDDQGRHPAGHVRPRGRRRPAGPVGQHQGRLHADRLDQPQGLRHGVQRGARERRGARRRQGDHRDRRRGRPPEGRADRERHRPQPRRAVGA